MCREARGGACVEHAEGMRAEKTSAKVEATGVEETPTCEAVTDSNAVSTKCAQGKCDVTIGGNPYCSKCSKLDEHLVDGKCVAASIDSANNCGGTPTEGVCKSCAANYFMYKGGCYNSKDAPGNSICTAAPEGKCGAAASDSYFLVPDADRDNAHQSVVSCGDSEGAAVKDSKVYKGVDGCAKCSAPQAIQESNGGTAAATCTECTGTKIVKTVNASGKSVTSCVEPTECKDGFFVQTTASGDVSSKVCTACDDENCDVCVASGAKKCNKCKTSGDKIYLQKETDSQTGTCVNKASCTGTNYIDEETKTCSACASAGTTGCKTCAKKDGMVTCTSCEDS